jgi:hypothetical protein
MKNFEKYLEVKARMNEFSSKAAALEGEVRKEEKAREAGRGERLRAGLLSGGNPAEIAAEEDVRLESLRQEARVTREAASILDRELEGSLRAAAIRDLTEKFWDPYGRAVRDLYQKLVEAEGLERKAVRIQQEAREAGATVGAGMIPILPPLCRILIEDFGELEYASPLNRFRRECGREKIDLD